jgi:hypothetical protein
LVIHPLCFSYYFAKNYIKLSDEKLEFNGLKGLEVIYYRYYHDGQNHRNILYHYSYQIEKPEQNGLSALFLNPSGYISDFYNVQHHNNLLSHQFSLELVRADSYLS